MGRGTETHYLQNSNKRVANDEQLNLDSGEDVEMLGWCSSISKTILDLNIMAEDMETQQMIDVQASETSQRSFYRRVDHTIQSSPVTPKTVQVVASPMTNNSDVVTNCDCGVSVSYALKLGTTAIYIDFSGG